MKFQFTSAVSFRHGMGSHMRPARGESERVPPFLQPPAFARVVLDPRLRTAAELVSLSSSSVPVHAPVEGWDPHDRRDPTQASGEMEQSERVGHEQS